METNYEQLRTRINELLPDRLELGIGTEISLPDSTPLRILLWDAVSEVAGNTPVLVHYAETCSRIESGSISKQDGVAIKLEGWQDILPVIVLGEPLTIEDVLRALHKTRPVGNEWTVSDNGYLRMEENYEQHADFDLTKPLSAPENEEACGAVLELLK